MDYEIGFLGYGRMARAISEGLDHQGVIPYHHQIVSGRDQGRLREVGEKRSVAVAADNRDLARRSKVVLLGVKPDQVEGVLDEVRDELGGRLLISMAAGVRLETLNSFLHATGVDLVRAMPNLPALVGRGATLICSRPGADPAHLERAREIFGAVGLCLPLEERQFDAATSLSGSGPAYFFTIIESLVRGAVRLGLSWETARTLAVQTALGAAETAARRPEMALADLRDQVTSPGGTTAEALYVLENGGLGGLLQKALDAASEKCNRLL